MPTIINTNLGTTRIITPTTQGLIGYWPLDEGISNIAHDLSGNNNHGTLVSSPIWTDGILGKALKFNGTNNYVRMNNASGLDLTSTGTLSAWVKSNILMPSVDGISKYRAIFSKANSGVASDMAYHLDWYGTSTGSTLRGLLSNGTTFITANVATFRFGFNWTHVAFIFNGSIISLYVNGVSRAQSNQTLNAQILSSSRLEIGRAFSSSAYIWSGLIDDARIYNRALSQSEITMLYKAGISKIS